MAKALLFLLLLLLLVSIQARSRLVTRTSSDSDLISDGIRHVRQPSLLLLERPSSSSESCEQTYGFLPCTTTIWGNLFLVLVYGYLMFLGAKYLSTGSELLLQILGPGIIGGLFLPILGALPDALLILVSGLSGSKETAQKQVLIGMGLLAGSTVMLLTLLWASCVVFGKCDLENLTSIDSQDTKRCNLTATGFRPNSQVRFETDIPAEDVFTKAQIIAHFIKKGQGRRCLTGLAKSTKKSTKTKTNTTADKTAHQEANKKEEKTAQPRPCPYQ